GNVSRNVDECLEIRELCRATAGRDAAERRGPSESDDLAVRGRSPAAVRFRGDGRELILALVTKAVADEARGKVDDALAFVHLPRGSSQGSGRGRARRWQRRGAVPGAVADLRAIAHILIRAKRSGW